MVSALGSADRGGRVAPAAADPSQVTGRVKGRDNQLHRARVLEVRIQSPPAESPSLNGNWPGEVEKPCFSRECAGHARRRSRQRPVWPGDICVQRGTMHAWVAKGSEPAVFAFVLIDAEPVEKGGKKLTTHYPTR